MFTKRKGLAGTEPYGKLEKGSTRLISLVTIVTLLGLWWLSTSLEWVRPLFLPSPEAVIGKFVLISCIDTAWASLLGFETIPECKGFANHTLLEHTGESLQRVFLAFFLAVITGIPVGLMMGVSRYARGTFDPIIEFYRPIPPLAYLPLTVIWLGIGEDGKVLLIYLACFAPLAISARAGVRSCSIEQIHAAYSMGANRQQLLWNVVFKAALPEIMTGMRIAIAFGWTTLVAAELVAAKAGLGVVLLNAQRFLATDIVFMGVVVIGLIALLFDAIMRKLDTILIPWKGQL